MRRKDYVERLYTKYAGQSFELSVQIYHSHENKTEIDSDKKWDHDCHCGEKPYTGKIVDKYSPINRKK